MSGLYMRSAVVGVRHKIVMMRIMRSAIYKFSYVKKYCR